MTGSLDGRTVLVTRPRGQADELIRALEARGARAIAAPAVEILPARSAELTRALTELRRGLFDWITLTSRNTVETLSSRVRPGDVRARAAVIGEGTAEAFRAWTGRDADLMPRTYTTAALSRAFPTGTGRVLCARADIAPEGLEESLAAKGWTPVRVHAYRTRTPTTLPREARDALRDGAVDVITFTSASTVRGFIGAIGAVRGNPKVVCIGPVTAREARARGLRITAVASPHTIEGLVEAVERACRPRRAPPSSTAGAPDPSR